MASIQEAIAAARANTQGQPPAPVQELTPMQQAIQAAQRQQATHQAPQGPAITGGNWEQFASGTNEGLAGMAGLPVDAVTGLLNLGAGGIEAVTGAEIGRIENPVGGSESLRNLLSPFISENQPTTDLQRITRRVGQEVGAGGIPGGAIMRNAARPFATAGVNLAADVAAGTAGGVAAEIAPENEIAQMLAAMAAGGLAAGSLANRTRAPSEAPSIAELNASAGNLYENVRNSPAQLTAQDTEQLSANMVRRLTEAGIDPLSHPKASAALGRVEELAGTTPTIASYENVRRNIGRNVAGALDPSERFMGQAMKDEIDAYLQRVAAEGRPDASTETIENLLSARNLHRRASNAQMLDTRLDKAARRAQASGTGGNAQNTALQNINQILDGTKSARGLLPEEIQAMRDIVAGGPTRNAQRARDALRLIGRSLSPTTGALQGGASVLGAGAVGTGALSPGFLAIPAIGMGAKRASEAMTQNQINRLSEQIRAGRPLPRQPSATNAIIAALAAQQGVQQ